jgi:hypothetical protein
MMLSSHLYLCLPLGLVVKGFHLNIFLVALASGILCIWPNQLSLWTLMQFTIFSCFISLSNSSLFLILHIIITIIIIFQQLNVGRDGSVAKANQYRHDGPGSNSGKGRDFPHPTVPPLGPTEPPYSRGRQTVDGGRFLVSIKIYLPPQYDQ